MKQGLVEWALVTAFLVLAAAGAAHVFGEDIRVAFGVHRSPPARSAPLSPPPRAP